MIESELLQKEMTAVAISEPGGPEVLQPVTLEVPKPKQGEVLIRVAAAGVNRPDVVQRQGLYPPPPDASPLPGLEVSGTVVALGDGVESEWMGRKVCALTNGGGYAQFCVTPVGQCLPVPESLTMAEAAALPETLFTVWGNLFDRGFAREGETVLVHGGTSGIGTTSIMLGKLFGLNVIVTCGSDQKCTAAKQIGADHAINYKSQDFVEEIKKITDGEGVEIVLDMVAGDYVARNLKCLKQDGRHVTIAVQGGVKATLNMAHIMVNRLTLSGSTLRPQSAERKALIADELHRYVWPEVEAGKLKPVMDERFALADAAKAHAHMEAGDHIGKIVLIVE
ncbi:NAD(P)H-quinone oxidoreductase [Parasphingorhabdus sp.]|uniref:NAD(P)H-quinone oxidoreductase n=1 Tax=Parasphingorhabdus sp. TaxID=2709688 RepID=UPI003A8F1D87